MRSDRLERAVTGQDDRLTLLGVGTSPSLLENLVDLFHLIYDSQAVSVRSLLTLLKDQRAQYPVHMIRAQWEWKYA